jgi:hypothetical protein
MLWEFFKRLTIFSSSTSGDPMEEDVHISRMTSNSDGPPDLLLQARLHTPIMICNPPSYQYSKHR